MGKTYSGSYVGVLRFVVGEPTQFCRSDRGNRDDADCLRPFLGSAELVDQIGGARRRSGVVPQQGISNHPARLVQADHAVLLSGNGHGRDVVEPACGGDGRAQRSPPVLGIYFGTRRVWRARRANDGAGLGITDHDLAGLR
ncbi:Uncharacterised protein [Mycobacteroides abscessus subsp. abscessus]|nr:Uncharacterised protein [Mycobacteroides abscessus subsp. abscessus]